MQVFTLMQAALLVDGTNRPFDASSTSWGHLVPLSLTLTHTYSLTGRSIDSCVIKNADLSSHVLCFEIFRFHREERLLKVFHFLIGSLCQRLTLPEATVFPRL